MRICDMDGREWPDIEEYADQILAPDPYEYSGALEQAEERARNNSRAIGRICAQLVYAGLIVVEEIPEMLGSYRSISKAGD